MQYFSLIYIYIYTRHRPNIISKETSCRLFSSGQLSCPNCHCTLNVKYSSVHERTAPHWGALTFSPLAFGPSDNSTCTFRSMDTGSQKRWVLVTNVPQSGPTVHPPQNRSLGPRKSWTNCSSISLGPTVIMASPTLWHIVLSNCSLSLWRVARGSKLMFLELIHGLFIT
jgi:hypothetical protein